MSEHAAASPKPQFRTVNVAVVSALDSLGRWGLTIDANTLAALGVSICPLSSAVGAGQASDAAVMEPDQLVSQLKETLVGLPIDVVKLGYLLDASSVDAVTDALVDVRGSKKRDPSATPIVIDPVLFDQEGVEVASALAGPVYVRRLLPLATVATPNCLEASVLAGFPVGDRSSMRDACKALFDHGVAFPLVKGHLERHSIDIAFDGSGFVEFGFDKLPNRALGSGCLHSVAIAAFIALGAEPLEAFDRAKKFVTRAVAEATLRGPEVRVVNPFGKIYAESRVEVGLVALEREEQA